MRGFRDDPACRVHRLGQSRPVQVFDFVAEPAGSEPSADLALAGLLRAGASLLGQLAAAADAAASGRAGGPGVRFDRDAATGKTVLRIAVPDSEALLGALRALARVVGGEGR